MNVHPPHLCLIEFGLYAGFRFARVQQLLGGETIHRTAVQQSQVVFFIPSFILFTAEFS
jgi:hypothetical protein